ncbi:MAG: RloB family protein [Myxococcota bacterium]|jgi:hypothetical protein|nr:RloB family protein [Myxococcota bacterium]
MSAARKRDDSVRRSPGRKQPKRRILIVCEGRLTEPHYFRRFQHATRNPLVHVEVAKETGVPLTVVQIAVQHKEKAEQQARRQHDDFLRWDEVWAVFDIDEHPHVFEALRLAEREAIHTAVSDPCFELWALLHFEDQRAHIERKQLRLRLKRHMPDYDKELDFDRMHPHYDNAVARATHLNEELSTRGRNPSTQVFLLTESIARNGH